ncbi:hypothetical protein [Nodosilinea sp. LEGE 07088]|uniref:hypothetical protein n=1 Tax=Nodosilinea sp. LEGE 07088 TaxID=2777968 RepID=UPI001D159A80|nr:hypothetical protein [Nodosilinea sp. LEGE 07088]
MSLIMAHQSDTNQPKGFGKKDDLALQSFTKSLRSKARREGQGYPIATVAYYGPNEELATKVAVGIVEKNQEVADLKRWITESSEIRIDEAVNREVLAFIKRKRAKQVIMTDGIMGCPHEEGIDYPEGEVCPQCPYWAEHERTIQPV